MSLSACPVSSGCAIVAAAGRIRARGESVPTARGTAASERTHCLFLFHPSHSWPAKRTRAVLRWFSCRHTGFMVQAYSRCRVSTAERTRHTLAILCCAVPAGSTVSMPWGAMRFALWACWRYTAEPNRGWDRNGVQHGVLERVQMSTWLCRSGWCLAVSATYGSTRSSSTSMCVGHAAVCTVGVQHRIRQRCNIPRNEPGTGLRCRSPELRPHPLWSTNSVRHKCSAAAMTTRSTARCLCRQSLRRTRESASR